MSNTRNLSNLLDSNGDVKVTHLDNAPAPTKATIEGLAIDLPAANLTGTINSDRIGSGAITAGKLAATLDLSGKTITLPAASVTAHATTPTLDSPSITGTLSVDDGGDVTHTIGNWSDELTYIISPTNCSAGAINSSGQFVITHTSGTPSYTIKATTDNLGLDDSSVVTKNILMNLSAPTINSPADVGTNVNLTYVIVSTSSDDTKIILDFGSSNFTYQSVSNGTGTKVGNTVEVTGFSGNPEITIQFTAEATYSVKAKSTAVGFGDSAYSSTDSFTCSDISFISATGGTITTDGDYKVHTFTTSGSFVVSTAGVGNDVQYLVIGGGASGVDVGDATRAGGGNASTQQASTLSASSVATGSHTITVGAGGASGTHSPTPNAGTSSAFGSFVTDLGASGAGTSRSGFPASGDGGSGAGGAAGGGSGGPGASSTISGSSITRGGGGGAGVGGIAAAGGGGGSGGGGQGGGYFGGAYYSGLAGAANTGSGGGGAMGYEAGGYHNGAGGSGIVVIRYQYQ
jgi:hypothetical protein